MITSFINLPASQEQKLQGVVSAIVTAVDPEKIICYGARTWLTNTWRSSKPVLSSVMSSDFDLLIITKPEHKRKDPEILDTINKYNTSEARIIPITHSIYAVNEALEQGREFFVNIYKEGILVYDSSGVPLPSPTPHDTIGNESNLQAHWDQYFGLGGKFLGGADYYIGSGNAALAAFMLHQATEHTCLAVIHACLGYRATTHNVERLLSLTENFTEELSYVFPQNSREEVELFHILRRAYSDVRYAENFVVSIEKAEALKKRVKLLRKISLRLYREKVKAVQPMICA